ncbi:unnamed protein product [Linum tenue]|uniref:histidine kinase n=1 Tax=Linum tenue TaxID=586396 RepID=A0AAV0NYH9_9ROSI|nr:unnamed protein product [Linum tenue]
MKPLRLLKQLIPPLTFLIVLAVSTVVFAKLRILINETELRVDSEIDVYSDTFYAAIEKSGKALLPGNETTATLATSLASNFNGSLPTFSTIMTKVAPTLFMAVSAIPKLSQASFASRDGLFLSVYREDNDRIFLVYSNASFSPTWFTQPVNHDTGEPYGVAVVSKAMLTPNTEWFRAGLDGDGVVSSMGRSWKDDHEGMLLSTVSVHGKGVISLGFATETIVDHFTSLNSRGLYLQLATQEGEVVVQPAAEAAVVIERFSNGVLTVRNGVNGEIGNLSCDTAGTVARSPAGTVAGIEGSFYCSTLIIGGVNMVYVLAYPGSGLMSLVVRITKASIILVGVLFSMVVLSLALFLWMATRATKRELYLCASLIKQTEATRQAERKSMNKTRIFAGISHDVRNSLAQLVALVQFCQEDTTNPDASKVAGDLQKVENCARDAVGMLESVLDINKLEAGKLELRNEDFNLGNLVEELVDRFYHLGIKKGVDVVFDPSDAFIHKSPHVHGDQTRVRQILSNLLSNAIKFTSEGHVKVRASVKRRNLRKDIIASNRTFAFGSLLSSCCWDRCGVNGESELDTLQMAEAEDPNEVEFEFEVDDTGKGIPKTEWKSVFEDYVQATNNNSASHSGGFGLGLGNVQSLVRLMKGELQIVEKKEGEKGTCFRFNVFLCTSTLTTEGHQQQQQQSPSITMRPSSFALASPRREDSQVMILVEGEERRKVLKRYIENTNIKVVILTHPSSLCQELEKIRTKLEISSPAATTVDQRLSRSVSNSSDSGRRNNLRTMTKGTWWSRFVLLVIDVNYHHDLHGRLLELKREGGNNVLWKIVWVHDRFMVHDGGEQSRLLQETLTSGGDYVVYKPFHGSRVNEVLSLLPGRNKGILSPIIPHGNAAMLAPPTTVQYQRISSNNSNCCWTIELGDPANCTISESMSTVRQEAVLVNSSDVGDHEEINKQPLKGKKVLIVDDVSCLKTLHGRMMRKLGASSVEDCTNGKEAIDKVSSALREQSREENGLQDWMPEMNGYEATRWIRAEEERTGKAGRIPIVAISGHSSTEEVNKSLEAGMDFHLTKPLKENELLDVVRKINVMSHTRRD